VSIVIKEFANKPISVMGAVGKPGPLNMASSISLMQAISAAGGLSPGAGKRILIVRRADNGLSDILEINVDKLLLGTNEMWNVPVYPSDVINIPARTSVKVFCLGEVKSPGAIEFDSDDRITLLTVIAKAGGLTDRASKTIRIKRKAEDGRDTEFTVNYKAVLAGSAPDPILKADDLLIVGESFF
jgi:polysaccharide export outer membrane protein